jgi:starch phosphorylase
VVGVPYDTPVAGYRTNTSTRCASGPRAPSQEFDFALFNEGDYLRAVEAKNASEVISKVLYPNDNFEQGRELRLKQEYFFVACSIHDIVWRYSKQHKDFSRFSEKVAIQLNDTHPAIAIAELMRVLVDEHRSWSGRRRGGRPSRPSATRTTPCCPRRSSAGRSPFSSACCRGTSRSSQEINRRFLREVMAFFPHSPSHVGA